MPAPQVLPVVWVERAPWPVLWVFWMVCSSPLWLRAYEALTLMPRLSERDRPAESAAVRLSVRSVARPAVVRVPREERTVLPAERPNCNPCRGSGTVSEVAMLFVSFSESCESRSSWSRPRFADMLIPERSARPAPREVVSCMRSLLLRRLDCSVGEKPRSTVTVVVLGAPRLPKGDDVAAAAVESWEMPAPAARLSCAPIPKPPGPAPAPRESAAAESVAALAGAGPEGEAGALEAVPGAPGAAVPGGVPGKVPERACWASRASSEGSKTPDSVAFFSASMSDAAWRLSPPAGRAFQVPKRCSHPSLLTLSLRVRA